MDLPERADRVSRTLGARALAVALRQENRRSRCQTPRVLRDGATTADEVLAGCDLSGTRALVTGASAGLGEETCRALAARGAEIVMAVRDPARGAAAIDRIRAAVPGARLELCEVDLASLAGVRVAVDQLATGAGFDLLVANAGIMACPPARTVDGWEVQFGTNHLGHAALLVPLADRLPEGGRVVILSSAGHRFGDVDLEDPNFVRTPYDPWVAYGRSKTANALFAVALDRHLAARGAHAWSVHPGMIVTELGRHLTDESIGALMAAMPEGESPKWKSVAQGAATTCWAATAPELVAHGGAYLEDCSVAEVQSDPVARRGVRPYAIDPDRAAALWDRTQAWLAG